MSIYTLVKNKKGLWQWGDEVVPEWQKYGDLQYCPSRQALVYWNGKEYHTLSGKAVECGWPDENGNYWDAHECEHTDFKLEEVIKLLGEVNKDERARYI